MPVVRIEGVDEIKSQQNKTVIVDHIVQADSQNTVTELLKFESGLSTEFIQAANATSAAGTNASTNVFKIGTFSNLQRSYSAEIVILGTTLYGNPDTSLNTSGKTTILLRGDNSEIQASPTDSLSGFFYSELERNRETGNPNAGMGCENVWFVPQGSHVFDIYVKYVNGWAGLETFVRCSQGVTFDSNIVDTGVETAPTNGVALPSRWTLGVHGEQALEVTQDNVYAQQEPVVTLADIGTEPNQVPLNQHLGSISVQSAENLTVGNLSATAIAENGFSVLSTKDIGTAPNNIPLNQHLGSMAYLNLGHYIQSGKTTLFVKGMDADPTTPVSDTLLFQRVGNQVTVYFALLYKDVTGIAGWPYLTGLPYTPTNKVRRFYGNAIDASNSLAVNPSTTTREVFYSYVNGYDTSHSNANVNALYSLKASLEHKIIYFRSYDLASTYFVEFKSSNDFYLSGSISYITEEPFDPTLGGL